MIIQCEKCATKFRFDDELMKKEGVWVRCGRCKHEFFQKDPSFQETGASDTSDPSNSSGENVSMIHEIGARETKGAFKEDVTPEEKPVRKTRSGRKFIKSFMKIFLVLVLTCALAAACLWSYMQISGVKFNDIVSTVPYLDKILDAEDSSALKLTQIKIADLKQQYVQNWILGDVLVVEGNAWNSAPFPVARIMVVATLYDANDVELARKEAFAGNILTPVELATLPEEAIERELSLSHGRDTSNDRIESHGSIPFMVVFTKSYPEAVKTKVHVAGTEKLLAN